MVSCGIKYQFSICIQLEQYNEFIFDTVRAYDAKHAERIFKMKYPQLRQMDITEKIYFNPNKQKLQWKDYLPVEQRSMVKPPYSFAESEDGT